jgi:hypothetical protein
LSVLSRGWDGKEDGWQKHGQQNDFLLFLVLVDEQGGFEVPSEEADYFNTCCRLWLRLF